MRNTISPDRQEQAEGKSELSSINKYRRRTCADSIQHVRLGECAREEGACDSFLFIVLKTTFVPTSVSVYTAVIPVPEGRATLSVCMRMIEGAYQYLQDIEGWKDDGGDTRIPDNIAPI